MIPPKLDEWIRAEIHKLTVDRRNLAIVLAVIDTLESQIMEAIPEEHALDLLSVRRALARLRSVRAVELDGDALLAKELYLRAVSLGFDTDDDAVVASALLSRICLEHGRADLLENELEDALRKMGGDPDPAYQRLADKVRKIRGRN
jgi:hypothetical protein